MVHGKISEHETVTECSHVCIYLSDVVAADMHDWFCDFYRKLSEYRGKGGVSSHPPTPSTLTLAPAHSAATDAELFNSECRRLCAYNFPVSALVQNQCYSGTSEYRNFWDKLFCSL